MVNEEIKRGHMLGPFNKPPLLDIIFSPINLVPKVGSTDKFRLIHDLAFPYNGVISVNDHILECNSKVEY